MRLGSKFASSVVDNRVESKVRFSCTYFRKMKNRSTTMQAQISFMTILNISAPNFIFQPKIGYSKINGVLNLKISMKVKTVNVGLFLRLLKGNLRSRRTKRLSIFLFFSDQKESQNLPAS